MDGETTTNRSNTSINGMSALPAVLVEAISSHNLTAKVMSKTILPAANVCEALSADKNCSNFVKMVTSLRCRAFSCFNNLVQALTVEELGGQGKTILKDSFNLFPFF